MNHIVFLTPGSGAGHIVRASALALELQTPSLVPVIIGTSPFLQGLARITGIKSIYVPLSQWKPLVIQCLKDFHPILVILDTFPFGFRGELLDPEIRDNYSFLYLARRLQVNNYLRQIGIRWQIHSPLVKKVIMLEPLTRQHAVLMQDNDIALSRLPGPIHFPWERFSLPVPDSLSTLLARKKVRLIVHTGKASELSVLTKVAEQDAVSTPHGPVVMISAFPPHGEGNYIWYEYFPAARFFSRAYRIITGAGYNSMAEGAYFAEKHIAIPFARKYDDQYGRKELTIPMSNGLYEAVERIRTLVV